ncbi:TPA: transposase [Salmonella enterica subsp. enterica serovar Bredeney]|uniref:Uncharacterized protein n=3 Tax=Salmonella enterica TaxID=28901 RepID=A0A5I3ELR2_SALET|nr:transposase [Salmonella enterica]EAA2100038.1 hypothetical protein [Salmonella enterica subsp. enterica serovar Bredeney]EAA7354190.1 hypothetical protein [Salmonella enterica subsp. enterica]EAB7892605.1 hypothetical protein [Salmonella enterica subsp. enterica serovar Newport]EBW5413709.1 hypothetical protein [Salmonella enterica subsp. enterica serovar Bonn]EBY7415660.1 hypothetical protein [Salmonella enterica subsp. enterica serovar Alachua]ECM6271260.1 hypothetical protein [Salmonell
MAKRKFNITNWKTYNNALRQRGALTLWISDDATAAWCDKAASERRGRPWRYTETQTLTVRRSPYSTINFDIQTDPKRKTRRLHIDTC